MGRGRITKFHAAALVLLLGACRTGPQERAPVIGQAYAAPAVLNLRRDIDMNAPVATTVHHGDKLEILQRRRVFLRVRTANGVEGWTEARQLLAGADMAALNDLAARAAKLPPQGKGMSYDDLNVHIQPSRQAPSFLLIKAKEKFEVLGHARAPDIDLPRAPLIPPVPKKAAPPKKSTSTKLIAPPMPKPPGLPEDWLELSQTDADEEKADTAGETPAPAKPVSTLDWSLVRTAEGPIGWVLTRRVSMAIPDEVAQYSEGHRIVSYFSLGKIQDGDEQKDIWLWTTVADGPHPYDFDSLRVFVWSLRHHRYETAHIERNLHGYLPVLLEDVPVSNGKGKEPVKSPGFSVCVEKDGSHYRRRYALLGQNVRAGGQEDCQAQPPLFVLPAPGAAQAAANVSKAAPANSTVESFRDRIRRWFKRRQ